MLLLLFIAMLSSSLIDEYDLDCDADDYSDEFYLECLRYNYQKDPNMFFKMFNICERYESAFKPIIKDITKRTRNIYNAGINFRDTPWGKLLSNPLLLIPESYFARQFQRRFRLPYPLFLELVDDAKEFNIFEMNNPYSTRLKIPIELKCMIALRMLGRDLCCDDVFELSYVPLSSCNKFYRQFIKGFANKVYSKYVYVPEGDELQSILNLYQK